MHACMLRCTLSSKSTQRPAQKSLEVIKKPLRGYTETSVRASQRRTELRPILSFVLSYTVRVTRLKITYCLPLTHRAHLHLYFTDRSTMSLALQLPGRSSSLVAHLFSIINPNVLSGFTYDPIKKKYLSVQ